MIDLLVTRRSLVSSTQDEENNSIRKDDRSDTEAGVSTDSESIEDTPELNDSTTWNSSIFFCPAPSMDQEKTENASGSLPLNEVVSFETDLFHGKIFFRVRDLPPKDEEKKRLHQEYFDGRKRLYQVVVQGQFQRDDISFRDLFIGARYDKPFDGIPGRKSGIVKKVQEFVKRLTPGMLFDIAADKPRVMAPLGSCQRLSVDKKGQEPSITESVRGIKENTKLMLRNDTDEEPFESSAERRKRIADPDYSTKFKVDPLLVYTFEIYDHTIDFANYKQHFGGFVKVDLTNKLNGQPLALTALMVPHQNGNDSEDPYKGEEVIYDFQVWHERLVKRAVIIGGGTVLDR